MKCLASVPPLIRYGATSASWSSARIDARHRRDQVAVVRHLPGRLVGHVLDVDVLADQLGQGGEELVLVARQEPAVDVGRGLGWARRSPCSRRPASSGSWCCGSPRRASGWRCRTPPPAPRRCRAWPRCRRARRPPPAASAWSASAGPATRAPRSAPPPSASSVTALSRLIIDPCPARPRAVSRIQAIPFSAASIRYIRRPRTVVLKPPTSPTASVQPSNSSGWSRISTSAPLWPPASSSAVKHSTIGRSGGRPARCRARTTRQQHRVEVLHVDRAAAPQVAVADLAGERVDLPVLRGRRYDVEVAVQQQPGRSPGRRRPSARPPTRGPARTRRCVRLDPDLVEQPGDVLRRLPLPRSVVVAVVRGVDPDQVAADLHDLGRGVVRRLVPERPSSMAPIAGTRDRGLAPMRGRSPLSFC